jgi:flagellar motor switch protein FliN/FliY
MAASGASESVATQGTEPKTGEGTLAKSVAFDELRAAEPALPATSLDSLLDVKVTVTADLGRTTRSIADILKLNVGSVLELDRLVTDPVDLMVQGVLLAKGEVVVVEDHFAIRIKEIVDPKRK